MHSDVVETEDALPYRGDPPLELGSRFLMVYGETEPSGSRAGEGRPVDLAIRVERQSVEKLESRRQHVEGRPLASHLCSSLALGGSPVATTQATRRLSGACLLRDHNTLAAPEWRESTASTSSSSMRNPGWGHGSSHRSQEAPAPCPLQAQSARNPRRGRTGWWVASAPTGETGSNEGAEPSRAGSR